MRKPLLIFVLFIAGFGTASAEIFYPTTNFRLENPPIYCIVKPSNENLSEDTKSIWIQKAKEAASAWESALKDADSENDSVWEIQTRVITDDDSGCDVRLEFKDKPSKMGNRAGYFQYPPAEIVIYYLKLIVCQIISTCYDDGNYNSPSQILVIALHEIGHSFGLDHYVSDDNEQNTKWTLENKSPPSIMIPKLHVNPSLQKITDADIQKVRSIYGSKGFYAFSEEQNIPEPAPTPQPEPSPPGLPEPAPKPKPPQKPPIIPETPFESIKISDDKIVIEMYEKKQVKITGALADEEYLRGHPVIITILKPDLSVEVYTVQPTRKGNFELILMFDKEAMVGKYTVSGSYIEHVDKDMDITFEVQRKSQESQPASAKKESDSLIPAWIKKNAGWWSDGKLEDHEFTSSIEYMIEKRIVHIPDMPKPKMIHNQNIPAWIKNTAGWWSADSISDDEFLDGIKYLIQNGIITVG